MATSSTLNQVVKIREVKHIDEELSHVRNGSLEISENAKLRITVDQSSEPVIEEQIRSHHILRYIGKAKDGSKLFDPYIMTLEELLQVKKGERNLEDLTKGCSKAVIKKLKNLVFLDSNNRPSKGGVDLLRDIIEGLYELYLAGLRHGELTTKNVVICSSEGKLIAKLTRIKGERRGTKKDYSSLGDIIKDCFVYDKIYLPIEADELYNCILKFGTKTKGLPESEWTDLANMREESFYKDPRSIFRHPFFWPADLCITFLIQFRILMGHCAKLQSVQAVRSFTSAMNRVKTTKWYDGLDAVVQTEADKNRTTDETEYLLRLIRNTYCHFDERNDDFKNTVGTPPEQLLEYFRAKYPDMLLGVHRVLQYHFATVQEATKFSFTFENFL